MSAHGLPPYSDIVFHADIQRQFDPETIGLLCWLIANAEPVGDGAWAVLGWQVEQIGPALSRSKGFASPRLKTLAAAGKIYISKGVGRGRPGKHGGGGKTRSAYYLTYHPSFGSPDNNPNLRNPSTRDLNNRNIQNRGFQKGTLQNRSLYALPPHETAQQTKKTEESNEQQTVLSVPKEHNKTDTPKPELSEGLTQLLDDIGYNLDQFPLPADIEQLKLVRVIQYAIRQRTLTDKARWVNQQIAKGLDQSMRENHIPNPDGPLPAAGRMDPCLYDELCENYPEWAAVVAAEAAHRFQQTRQWEKGQQYVPPALKWQVAHELGRPDQQADIG